MALDPTISLGVKTPEMTSPIDQVSKVIALRDMISQNALRQQQVLQSQVQTQDLQAQAQQRQKELADRNLTQDSFLAHKDDGDQTWNNVLKDIQGKVSPDFYNTLAQGHAKTVQEGLSQTKAQIDQGQTVLSKVDNGLTGLNVLDDSDKPVEYQNLINRWRTDPDIGPKIQQFIQNGQIPPHYDPDSVKQIHATVVGQKGLLDEEEKRQSASKDLQEANAAAALTTQRQIELPKIQAEADIAAQKAQFMKNASTAQWNTMIDQAVDPVAHAPLNNRTKALVQSALKMGDINGAQAAIKDASDQIGRTETALASAKATAPIKISVAGAEQQARDNITRLTDDDVKREGQQYAITGTLPNIGMGGKADRERIMHAKDEFARNSGFSPKDMAVAAAAYKGDTGALIQMDKTSALVNQAEQTAGKNLDNFLGTASKIIDTGSPILNKPIRSISDRGLGSTDLAAFNAARQVATTEVARVLSQVSGTGSGVVSDSARKEVSTLMSPDSTIKQIYSSAKILRQDMGNRLDSINSVTNDIKGRMGVVTPNFSTASSSPNTPTLPSKFSQSDVGKTFISPKTGESIKIKAVSPDGLHFKRE